MKRYRILGSNDRSAYFVMLCVAVLVVCGFRSESCPAEDITAQLNGTKTFLSPSSTDDTLYVDAGSTTIMATKAQKLQGYIWSHIDPYSIPDHGIVEVATVVDRQGDSLYEVDGDYVSGGGGGGGGVSSTWKADYNNGGADCAIASSYQIQNGDPVGAVLTVSVAGGDPEISHKINLTETDPSGDTGFVSFANDSVTVIGNGSQQVNVRGVMLGQLVLGGNADGLASGTVLGDVVDGARVDSITVEIQPDGTFANDEFSFTDWVKVAGAHLDQCQFQQEIESSTWMADWNGVPENRQTILNEYDYPPGGTTVAVDTNGQLVVDDNWSWDDIPNLSNQNRNGYKEDSQGGGSAKLRDSPAINNVIYQEIKLCVQQRYFKVSVRDKSTGAILMTHEWGYTWNNALCKWTANDNPPVPAGVTCGGGPHTAVENCFFPPPYGTTGHTGVANGP